MTYGQIVAKRWKKQYCKRNKWFIYADWDLLQPSDYYTILLELKSKEAIRTLIGFSWVKRLPKKVSNGK